MTNLRDAWDRARAKVRILAAVAAITDRPGKSPPPPPTGKRPRKRRPPPGSDAG